LEGGEEGGETSDDRGLAFEARVLPKGRMYLVCGGCKVRRRVSNKGIRHCKRHSALQKAFGIARSCNEIATWKSFSAAYEEHSALHVLATRQLSMLSKGKCAGDSQEMGGV
jgi:hypothetical protein